jgi:hypothetical protein
MPCAISSYRWPKSFWSSEAAMEDIFPYDRSLPSDGLSGLSQFSLICKALLTQYGDRGASLLQEDIGRADMRKLVSRPSSASLHLCLDFVLRET